MRLNPYSVGLESPYERAPVWASAKGPCCTSSTSRNYRGRGLTPPSSGQPRARFACFRLPLMSNVRAHRSRHATPKPRISSHASGPSRNVGAWPGPALHIPHPGPNGSRRSAALFATLFVASVAGEAYSRWWERKYQGLPRGELAALRNRTALYALCAALSAILLLVFASAKGIPLQFVPLVAGVVAIFLFARSIGKKG